MKFSTSAYLSLSLVTGIEAFPSLKNLDSAEIRSAFATSQKRASSSPAFDAQSQLVSTSGLHAFVPPGPGDARGPCPGLNALANHNYLPHNGYALIPEFELACRTVFGMGDLLATVLSAYGAALDGSVLGWSIGGLPHTGIGGSHGNYETDSSPMRGDLYQYGSNSDLVMSQFQEFYDMQPDAATANYDLSVLRQFRLNRFNQSVSQNPYFYYGPFTGTSVSQAAFSFIYRFMGNKSAEAPEGILNKDVLKSFFSIQGTDDSNLTWVPGHERIPDNWYTRNSNDHYDIFGNTSLANDIGYLSSGHSYISQPGCNTGTVNSYVTIDVHNLTAGAYSPDDLLTNPFCFGLAFANTIANSVPVVNGVVAELLLPLQNLLLCKTIPQLDESAAQACPGYSFFGGPTAAVAPGAIQN